MCPRSPLPSPCHLLLAPQLPWCLLASAPTGAPALQPSPTSRILQQHQVHPQLILKQLWFVAMDFQISLSRWALHWDANMPLLQVAGDTGWVNAQSIPLLIQGLKNIRMETSDLPCDTHHPAANQQIVVKHRAVWGCAWLPGHIW